MPEVHLISVPAAAKALKVSERMVRYLIYKDLLTVYRQQDAKGVQLLRVDEVEARRQWQERREAKAAAALAREQANPPPERKLPPSAWTQAPEKLIKPPVRQKAKR